MKLTAIKDVYQLVNPEQRPSSIRLVRNASCKYDHEERAEYRNRGRKVHFTIEIRNFVDRPNSVERDLSGMEALLTQAGWENDTCPVYDEGISCGFWIHPDEVAQFRADYKASKAALSQYLADVSVGDTETSSAAREPDDLLPIAADGTLTVEVVTLRTNKAKKPLEFAIVENQVFVRSVDRLSLCYMDATIRASRGTPDNFIHVPSTLLPREFIEANRAAFDELEKRSVTLEPDRLFEYDGTPESYQAAVIGLAHKGAGVRG